MPNPDRPWASCQLGAREHYAIPRALQSVGKLDTLITDTWVPPGSSWRRLQKNLSERFHPEIPESRVCSSTSRSVAFELSSRLLGFQGWERMIRRNLWFQNRAVKTLETRFTREPGRQSRGTLFSFSYTALEPFRWAKSRGWKTILGQIDPGIGEENHIRRIQRTHEDVEFRYPCAPADYWNNWREECGLADTIVVNSWWSKERLVEVGISPDKIEIVPLAYDPPPESTDFCRIYPSQFSATRPLRVLFLGQVSARKGVVELLESARLLAERPVEFWMVGPEVFTIPRELREQATVKWMGAVPRGNTAALYRNADLFLFPTHSDGFGLTQLEAQAWRLPLIASPYCGKVVQHGINGLELTEVTAGAIAEALKICLDHPEQLAAWSSQADDLSAYSIEQLSKRLISL